MTPNTEVKPREQVLAQYKKGNIFHVDYVHADYLEYWLQKFTKDGSCLNVCCGSSSLGDVRLDISPNSTRTMEGDLFKLLSYFKPNEFDYVYIDPLFKFYTSGQNRFQWQFDAFEIARKCLITRRPKVSVNLPSRRHSYIIAEDTRPSFTVIRMDYK